MRFALLLLLILLVLAPLIPLGQGLEIEQLVEEYHSWDTGASNQSVHYRLRAEGRPVDAAQLGQALTPGGQDPGVIQLAAAVSTGPDQVLVLFSRASGGDYALAQLSLQAGRLQAQVLLEPVPYPRFGDARVPGWLSLRTDRTLYLVQGSPVRVIEVGPGVLLAIRDNLAVLADVNGRRPASLYAVSLEDGRRVSSLALDCLVVPTVEVEASALTESSATRLRYEDGPAWFARHFALQAGSPTRLVLRSDHALAVRPGCAP
ncbi:MAG: hypothetical protein ABWY06_02925 [Pseudomonas sp.]|uniref:hypothetical protein n=1 Tax=Pseudomonas sp. TaxID=306 RepID=UPI0033984C5E